MQYRWESTFLHGPRQTSQPTRSHAQGISYEIERVLFNLLSSMLTNGYVQLGSLFAHLRWALEHIKMLLAPGSLF